MNEERAIRRRCLAVMAAMVCLVVSGCDAAKPGGTAKEDSKHHALTIYGYNYTNQYIDQFSVDGRGGSNLFVSKPTSGGGKGTCCIGWTDGTPLPTMVTVRWVDAACSSPVTNSLGETREVLVHHFKEEQVQLTGPVPKDPGYFEVHIYPDQHAEVAITQFPSEPRLKLDPAREVENYPLCPPETK